MRAMKIVNWKTNVEDKLAWKKTVEQAETHPGCKADYEEESKFSTRKNIAPKIVRSLDTRSQNFPRPKQFNLCRF